MRSAGTAKSATNIRAVDSLVTTTRAEPASAAHSLA
jgi:hypothetical protein